MQFNLLNSYCLNSITPSYCALTINCRHIGSKQPTSEGIVAQDKHYSLSAETKGGEVKGVKVFYKLILLSNINVIYYFIQSYRKQTSNSFEGLFFKAIRYKSHGYCRLS